MMFCAERGLVKINNKTIKNHTQEFVNKSCYERGNEITQIKIIILATDPVQFFTHYLYPRLQGVIVL
jgi:hypothetical protein